MRRIARDGPDPWIAQHQKIRPARHPLNRIFASAIARHRLRRRQCRQMPARRKPNHHNAIRIDVIIAGPRPHHLHRPPRIQQRHRQQISVRTQPIAQHKRPESPRRKPVRYLPAFQIRRQMRIGPAREAPPPPIRCRARAADQKSSASACLRKPFPWPAELRRATGESSGSPETHCSRPATHTVPSAPAPRYTIPHRTAITNNCLIARLRSISGKLYKVAPLIVRSGILQLQSRSAFRAALPMHLRHRSRPSSKVAHSCNGVMHTMRRAHGEPQLRKATGVPRTRSPAAQLQLTMAD